jgi:hypothetical protein
LVKKIIFGKKNFFFIGSIVFGSFLFVGTHPASSPGAPNFESFFWGDLNLGALGYQSV